MRFIEESDLKNLIGTSEQESRILDFKQRLPGKDTKSKRSFVHDIASFANAGGGTILYGIAEKDGAADTA